MAGRLLFPLLSALVASTGMTTFGEIFFLFYGTSSRETQDIKDGITFSTLITRDVAIRLVFFMVGLRPASIFLLNFSEKAMRSGGKGA